MSDINWKEGAVCYAYSQQWLDRNGDADGVTEADLVSVSGNGVAGTYNAIRRNDFQLNEIREGDFIPASELDTEQKYNEVVEVFGLFGFEHGEGAEPRFKDVSVYGNLTICHDGIYATELTKKWCKRQLTYHQIIAIGKLKRMMLERAVPAVEFGAVADSGNEDNVKSPKHYQLIEGVESIEIIARSMTKEQWKGFCLGNMLKYRIRTGKKDALKQDIAKADFYGDLYEMHKEKCYD